VRSQEVNISKSFAVRARCALRALPRQPRRARVQPDVGRAIPRLGLARTILPEPYPRRRGALYPALGAFRRRMGSEIAGDSDEDVPTLVGIAPLAELPHAGIEYLVGMETCVFAQ
jgi:hypothetical protein